ncbi:Uma2 family endonuclease [Lamprocystis purpurea]|jgi:Uma2 family endonuclease|uniref:Uma2 family endonuclease n=1 Tax=Lamprocystis purpurea TaxID=61598 RepID=UPI00037FBAEA|nr:Uma2 family endonuclease [Lamprocystis purpurea]
MSNLAEVPFISVDDYLAGETLALVKHEYVDGEVFAMAGATEQHVTITLNVAAMLRAHVRGGPCRVYMADMKLRVEAARAFFYPDVFVTCDPADGARPLVKERARIVIEVLSDSSEAYDRGGKFASYRQLATLEEYVLIDSRAPAVEVFRRHPEGWMLQSVPANGPLRLHTLGFACALEAVYEDVHFPPAPAEQSEGLDQDSGHLGSPGASSGHPGRTPSGLEALTTQQDAPAIA